MSVNKNQSAIREVRDQMSLDHADGKHLNIVTANLGITRPVIGFTDDVWRALVKQIAVEFKQIVTQYHKLLAILFGPQITEVNTLSQAASVGDMSIFLNRDDNIPQIGTIILDEGLASEETVEYCLINRRLHEVFLVTALVNDHLLYGRDAEQPLLLSGGSVVAVPSVRNFSGIDFPYTVVVGRGTEAEEVTSVTGIDLDENSITLAAPLSNAHEFMRPTLVDTTLLLDYVDSSVTLHLVDTKQFPETGTLILGPASDAAFVEDVGGSTTEITVAVVIPTTFTAKRLVGYTVIFDGNVTALLEGIEVGIVSNTGTVLTFDTALAVPHAVGDTFKIRPRVDYSSVDYSTNDVVIRRSIADLTLVAGTGVELLVKGSTIAMAPVKSQGTGWDVIQSTPKKVEILIPEELQENDLRSASYLHTNYIDPTPKTALTSDASLGGTTLLVDSVANFPVVGVVTVDPGNPLEENVGYFIPSPGALIPDGVDFDINFVDGAAFDDTITRDAGSFLDDGFKPGQTIVVTGADNGANDVTTLLLGVTATELIVATAILTADTENESVVIVTKDPMILPTGTLDAAHLATVEVQLYQPRYPSTDLLDGNIYDLVDVFPGPYVYDPRADAPNGAKAFSTSVSILSGPTKVAMRQVPGGSTALEVENAAAFPLTGPFPFDLFVGRGGGTLETVTVQAINLKQRVFTTLVDPATAGVTEELVVVDVTLGLNANFPTANGYRVRVGGGTPEDEVVYVIGVDTGTDTIQLADPVVNSHAPGVDVELLADVLTVEQVSEEHLGTIAAYHKRSTLRENEGPEGGTALIPVIESADIERADLVEVPYSSINVASTLDFPVDGNVILNFGSNQIEAELPLGIDAIAPTPTLSFADTSALPTVYPFEMTLSKGKIREEVVLIGLNALNTLTLVVGTSTRLDHFEDENMVYTPGESETVELPYTSISGNTLVFDRPFVVKSTHYPSEIVIPSKSKSVPKDNGFDFPFRMPADFTDKLGFLLDLLRAAGVAVCLIKKR